MTCGSSAPSSLGHAHDPIDVAQHPHRIPMASPRIIKKYPNRRLYDTETSTYITLADVKDLVLQYKEFQVKDAKSGEDLTRALLLQIILEAQSGRVPVVSTVILAHITRYYGHPMK